MCEHTHTHTQANRNMRQYAKPPDSCENNQHTRDGGEGVRVGGYEPEGTHLSCVCDVITVNPEMKRRQSHHSLQCTAAPRTAPEWDCVSALLFIIIIIIIAAQQL